MIFENMVRKERLELSHPKILEPKSSASTNSATSAFLSQKRWLEYQDLNLGMAGSKPAALPLGDTPTEINLKSLLNQDLNLGINE